MKKVSVVLAILIMINIGVVHAETDVSTLSLEELIQLRSEVSSRIVELYLQRENETPTDSLGTIADLFPDEAFAMAVRDAIGKLSISQEVTQKELDEVKDITVGSKNTFGEILSLEGIGYLRNLESLVLVNHAAGGLKELPEGFYQLIHLRYVNLHRTSLQGVSPMIGNLVNLKSLLLSGSELSSLPDELINCASLKELDISYSRITEVPQVLFSMPDVKVSMEGTSIK